MKKILHVITRLDRGGSSEDVMHGYHYFKKKGWQVRIAYGKTLAPSTAFIEAKAANEADFICIPSLVRAINPFLDVEAFFALLALIARERPDILHTHTSKAGFIGRCAGKCYVKFLKRGLKIFHSTHGHVFYGYYPAWISWIFVQMEKFAARFTGRIAVLTDNEVSEHLERGIGILEQFRVIHSGIDYQINFKEKNIRNDLGIDQKALIIGSVGRLDPVKGYDVFITAAKLVKKKLPDSNLFWLLVGDGTRRTGLQKRARDLLKDKQILFSGWKDNVADFMVIMDIYVQPSRNEGIGKTVLLAQLLRRPIIATRVQGLASIVKDGVSGLLVAPNDPRSLAEAVLRLIENPELRGKLGTAAQLEAFSRDRESGYQRYSVALMNYLEEKLYDE